MRTNKRTVGPSKLVVSPGKPLRGELGVKGIPALPGDKSLSHRAALFAALADGTSRVDNFLVSGVTTAMLNGLTALDVPWELEGNTLIVEGVGVQTGEVPFPSNIHIDCGNSATTMRLLTGAIAAWGVHAVLDGSEGLRRRPMGRIVEPLRQMGVPITGVDGCAPLTLEAGQMPLRPLDYELPVASAQVKSCLALAALSAGGLTVLKEPGPSRDHTERMLRSMGVQVLSERSPRDLPAVRGGLSQEPVYLTAITPPGTGSLLPLNITLPGDISAAAFLIVAALITPGSEFTLRNVGLNPTRTGLLDALKEMGADLVIDHRSDQGGEPLGDIIVRYSRLEGAKIGGELVVRMIDEFPAFSVAASFAKGKTVVEDALELRHKESDRISALCQELNKLGVEVAETPDGFVLHGGKPVLGGSVYPHGDHRLAMSMAVAGLASEEPVTVDQAGIINESFPDFSAILVSLGADVKTVE